MAHALISRWGPLLVSLSLFLPSACGGGSTSGSALAGSAAGGSPSGNPGALGQTAPPASFRVELSSLESPRASAAIEIPNGRPAYALLVSGFHQNKNFELFHFYNFAKCLNAKGAYVHFAWWNNLLEPYMAGPLHDPGSVPSTGPLPIADMLNVLPFPALLDKAFPNDDYQFQADALALLTEIHANNPQAAIILVGHSMGGDAVARLALRADAAGIPIDLLAPIDPVGNRSCIPYDVNDARMFCNGLFNFTRWRATHMDWLDPPDVLLWDPNWPDFDPFSPPRRAYSSNIGYLYHRWQQEFAPPFDYPCPPGGNPNEACLSFKPYSEYLFIHPDTHVETIDHGSTNVQSMVVTSDLSGYDVFPPPSIANSGGEVDGHGEIVGFRGVIPFTSDSYPMALAAEGDWPTRLEPLRTEERVYHLKQWEHDPEYLRMMGFEPKAPDLCMVSGDLCTILQTAINLVPTADAGPDQTIECAGPTGALVTLDGSGSSDPNGQPLEYTWAGPFGTRTGVTVDVTLPMGTHLITLTVDDEGGKYDSDLVVITVRDTTPPSLEVSLSPNELWPPNHKMVPIAASIQVGDLCDQAPEVQLLSITCNEPDNGLGGGDRPNDIQGARIGADDRSFSLRCERAGGGNGRVYLVTYRAADASGNAVTESAEVRVPHSQGK
jgi:pimeloyl-ACP methyl ester carboxylesterase